MHPLLQSLPWLWWVGGGEWVKNDIEGSWVGRGWRLSGGGRCILCKSEVQATILIYCEISSL